jgi:NMT1/THI5 like
MLRRLIAAFGLVLAASHPGAALDQVSMQLKWKHQFQFAGYYAALEKGFYRDAGLDVVIREGGPGIDVSEAVASGGADFGVCSSSVLRDWTVGRRLVACGGTAYPRMGGRVGLLSYIGQCRRRCGRSSRDSDRQIQSVSQCQSQCEFARQS